MDKKDKFGIYRSIRPAGVFPNAAWEIDNTLQISNHEILIDVKILNIDIVSFIQLLEQSYGNVNTIADSILHIIHERGKMQNLVTGTGGTLYGIVEEIGEDYKNPYNLKVGDAIITLNSLTGIPLKLTKIKKINVEFAQIEVEGKAVLFENCPIQKKLPTLETHIQISALEMAGEIAYTASICAIGKKVLIFGATSKMGLLCALIARQVLGNDGELIGFYKGSKAINPEIYKIFTHLEQVDDVFSYEIPSQYKKEDGYFDVVIDCSSTTLIEPLCIMLAKNRGNVFFPSWQSASDLAGLVAESLGKDLQMCFYKGYSNNQNEIFENLVEHNKDKLKLIVQEGLHHDFKSPWMDILKKKQKTLNINQDEMETVGKYIFIDSNSRELLKKLLKVAKFDCNVLVTGETGTGKEITSTIIHQNSFRNKEKLIKINCASIPEQLLESELFGYEKGAFTGSNPNGKLGLWEQANHGTLFLDEIGEIPLSLQAKLLRVLESNEFFHIGGLEPIKTNVRVICATNRNLWEMVQEKRFREDLYYRLNVFSVKIPSLRNRREDIIPLIEMFTHKYNEKYNLNKTFMPEAKEYLKSLNWPGNIRELDNVVQQCFVGSNACEISLTEVIATISIYNSETMDHEKNIKQIENTEAGFLTDEEFLEKQRLIEYKNRYGSTRKIAKAMGISQSSVVRRLKKYQL